MHICFKRTWNIHQDTPHSGPEESYYKFPKTEMIHCIILDQNGTYWISVSATTIKQLENPPKTWKVGTKIHRMKKKSQGKLFFF